MFSSILLSNIVRTLYKYILYIIVFHYNSQNLFEIFLKKRNLKKIIICHKCYFTYLLIKLFNFTYLLLFIKILDRLVPFNILIVICIKISLSLPSFEF